MLQEKNKQLKLKEERINRVENYYSNAEKRKEENILNRSKQVSNSVSDKALIGQNYAYGDEEQLATLKSKKSLPENAPYQEYVENSLPEKKAASYLSTLEPRIKKITAKKEHIQKQSKERVYEDSKQSIPISYTSQSNQKKEMKIVGVSNIVRGENQRQGKSLKNKYLGYSNSQDNLELSQALNEL